ncbi:MAG: Rossmann-like and DUF2520 domain-containing protein [Clostridiales bacterium]
MYNYKTGLIGAGKVGCSIAIGLKKKNIELSGIYTKSQGSLDYLNDKLNTNFRNDLENTVESSEVIFIATSDSELEYITRQIINLKEISIKGKCFFHLSGALDSDELNLLNWQGAFTGSLHPIQTFANKKEGWKGLENIYFGFEGSLEARKIAAKFATLFEGYILLIKKDAKRLYHIAACFISNYLVSLAYTSEKLFELAGIDKKVGLDAFEPLVKNTLENIYKMGTVNALTGPVSRGDINTIAEHISSLHKNNSDLLDLYNSLGKITTEIAYKKKTIDKYSLEKMNTMFSKKDVTNENKIDEEE